MRELKEETGAIEFALIPIGIYSVVKGDGSVSGGKRNSWKDFLYKGLSCSNN